MPPMFRRSERRRSAPYRLGAIVLALLTMTACSPQPAPELDEDRMLAPDAIPIESREEHREVTAQLIDQLKRIMGVEHAAAFIIEEEGFIAIRGAESDEYPVVRSLRKEVAMRSVEISPQLKTAWVTDDPDLFTRIQAIALRIHEGEDSTDLRQDIAEVRRVMKETGISDKFTEEQSQQLHPGG